MDNVTIVVMIGAVAAVAVAFIAGYICGSHSERVEWNRLIEEDRLPRPVVEPVRFRRA
jgi:hypothetical protein